MADDSKTEKATPKKKRDERKKGNVYKSQDVIVLVSLLGSFYCLMTLGPFICDVLREFTIKYFNKVGEVGTLSNEAAMLIQTQVMEALVKAAFPLLLVSVFLGVIATGVQTRWLFSKKALAPKFDRLNPISGIKKMFSIKNAVELLKNILKISLLIYIIYDFIFDRAVEVPSTMRMDLNSSSKYLVAEVMRLIRLIGMWFLAIAGFDFLYQRWDYERQLRMSKQEIKEEYKQTEGDPQVKGRIRRLQQERAKSRMMQAVPGADMVVKNPTHFAVALKYNPELHSAPIVVAKGQDELALRIIKIAEQNNVYVKEDKPLARFLYSTTKLNQEIPQEVYGAIAEILIYIYKLNHKEKNN